MPEEREPRQPYSYDTGQRYRNGHEKNVPWTALLGVLVVVLSGLTGVVFKLYDSALTDTKSDIVDVRTDFRREVTRMHADHTTAIAKIEAQHGQAIAHLQGQINDLRNQLREQASTVYTLQLQMNRITDRYPELRRYREQQYRERLEPQWRYQ